MLKIIATTAVVSKGFDGNPALRFSENGDSVRFRIGSKVYDTRAENNTRWVNLSVKAFGNTCERIRKMGLKEGSLINFMGRFDEDTWTDQATGTQKSAPVVILDEIEYAGGHGKSKDGQKSQQPEPYGAAPQYGAPPQFGAPAAAPGGNFAGYEPLGSGSYFDLP